MTQYLPPNLLALFAPREPIPYLPPLDRLPHEKKTHGYQGVGVFTRFFENPKDTPPPTRVETREERLERKRREKAEQAAYKLEQDIALFASNFLGDPLTNGNNTSDPYKTLFIARINYDTSESKLRREFEVFGSVKKIHLVHDVKTGKPRGYAFIEYEHERDMHSAYKHADGKKIDGRRVLVDVERARTVKGWLPRRLGGGLGGTRRGGPDVNIKHSGREEMRGEERNDRTIDRGERGERGAAAGGGGGGGGGGERERPERPERRRSRSRSPRERRRKPRARPEEINRDRRRDRRKRSRDRSRDRDKDRGRGDKEPEEKAENNVEEEKRERKRSRSRERDRKRSRRSRSRSPRDRDRKSKRDRDRRDRGDRGDDDRVKLIPVEQIKVEEEEDDSYSNGPPLAEMSEENSADAYGEYDNSRYDDYGDGDGDGDNDNDNGDSNNASYYSGYNAAATPVTYPGMLEPFEIKQEPVDEEEASP